MIRGGKLCRDCNHECKDIGTENEPLEIECPSCGGAGCGYCDGVGDIKIDGCPNQVCSDMIPAIELIDFFNEGMPPIAGGVLDQSAWFLAAARRLKNDELLVKAE